MFSMNIASMVMARCTRLRPEKPFTWRSLSQTLIFSNVEIGGAYNAWNIMHSSSVALLPNDNGCATNEALISYKLELWFIAVCVQ